MKIRSVRHKGLRRFIEADDASGLPANVVTKIRDILTFLEGMATEADLRLVPSWKAHQLTGGRRGSWALHVTRNWRITFQIDRDELNVIDLDYEDYH